MDSELAVQITTVEGALRATLDSLEAHAGDGSDTRELIRRARALAAELKETVERLDDDDESEGARRNAAYLETKLAVLEKPRVPVPAR